MFENETTLRLCVPACVWVSFLVFMLFWTNIPGPFAVSHCLYDSGWFNVEIKNYTTVRGFITILNGVCICHCMLKFLWLLSLLHLVGRVVVPICCHQFWSNPSSWYNTAWLIVIQLFGCHALRGPLFTGLRIVLLGCLLIFHWFSKSSPNGVLDILRVESNKEAKDGEEHDTVGCENKATRSTINLKKTKEWERWNSAERASFNEENNTTPFNSQVQRK